MGCESGVTIYDADAIEEHFGSDVWQRSGWGKEHSMPLVTIDKGTVAERRLLVADWTSGLDRYRKDNFEAAREAKWFRDEYGRAIEKWPTWAFFLGDDADQEFAMEVATWARDHALIASVETWT